MDRWDDGSMGSSGHYAMLVAVFPNGELNTRSDSTDVHSTVTIPVRKKPC